MKEQTTTEKLFEHYNTYTGRSTVENSDSQKKIFRYLQRILNPWLPINYSTNILDIGCGEGALLAFLKHKGYVNLSGFDISSENVSICHRLGFSFVEQCDVLKLREYPITEQFDVIFALDIIEHLPKQAAAEFLEQIHKRLNSGGYVVIQTPNMGSLLASISRYGDLSHEFGLTEGTARNLLIISGFAADKIEIKPSWNASTVAGYMREAYLSFLHKMIYLTEGTGRPKIPTKNILIRAFKS